MKSSVAFLFSGLAAQQVSATWNVLAPNFNTPQYNNNQCSDKQKSGFNWDDLEIGVFTSYEQFTFGGGSGSWTCANSFGKRDVLTKRSFSPKCIKNTVKKDKPANFGCGNSIKDGFSVTEIEVSVEFECDLEFHFTMPDNSICKQIQRCSQEGTVVQNTQCGGAMSVDIYLGDHDQQGRDDCEIGFHGIGFDCSPSYSPSKNPSPPPPPPPPSPDSTTYNALPKPPKKSHPAEKTPPSQSSPAAIYGTYVPYANSSAPAGGKPNTPPPVPGPSSPPLLSTAPAYSTPEAAMTPEASSSPKSNPPSYNPPECLPKCLNTWLTIKSKCKDNTDANCYCANPDFTKEVIDCVAAWSKDDQEIQTALQFLIGICAAHVPQNPGLITNCPSNIPLNPTTPPTPTGSNPAMTPGPAGPPPPPPPPGPLTAITYTTTVTMPCGCGVNGSSTVSTSHTAVTVPQVVFSTDNPTQPAAPGMTPTYAPAALVPGTPAPVPAAAPAATTNAPPYPMPSSFGTITSPSNGTNATGLPVFTGAAAPMKIGAQPALLVAMLGLFALLS